MVAMDFVIFGGYDRFGRSCLKVENFVSLSFDTKEVLL